MTILALGVPDAEPSDSIFLTRSKPSVTSPAGDVSINPTTLQIDDIPNTTWAPSSHEVTTVVMKNWEPLVFLPALAMERIPGFVCFNWKFSSIPQIR